MSQFKEILENLLGDTVIFSTKSSQNLCSKMQNQDLQITKKAYTLNHSAQ